MSVVVGFFDKEFAKATKALFERLENREVIFVFIVIILWWSCTVNAQIITGIVCDKATKLPVSDVYVYLDGTTIHTITNASGKFELTTNSIINTKLVMHHLSYNTAIIDNPFGVLPDTLFIEEMAKTIPALTIGVDRFTRRQKMKAFYDQFLGTTRAGRSATIVNHDDIYLKVDMQTRRLYASSDNPIVVVNNYLGYQVTFSLVDFWVQYGNMGNSRNSEHFSLDNNNVLSSFFAVTSSFVDLAPDNRRIKQRRDNVYERSSSYFFKSLANDALKDNNYTVYNRSFPVNHKQYFATKDTIGLTMIRIIPGTDINRSPSINRLSLVTNREQRPLGIISVLYGRNVRSDIIFLTDSFLVDQYGNFNQIENIIFTGQFGENRAGDMLPINYEP